MSKTRAKSAILMWLLAAGAGSCGADQARPPATLAPRPAAQRPPAPAHGLVSATEANTANNPDLADQLRPIRANVRRISSITEWSATAVSSLDEPGEGGEASFYYAQGQLEKVVARHFGEMSQRQVTYYLRQGQPSFVLEQAYAYNRPMYYDSVAMKQGHDDEAFAFDKSTVKESRSYFSHGQLMQQLSNKDFGAPFADDYLRAEQKRLMADFRAVMKTRQR